MPPIQSKLTNKKLHAQAREMIYNVTKFMENEARAGTFTIPIDNVRARVAEATGVSIRTISKIKKEGKTIESNESSFVTPDKKRHRAKPVVDIDGVDDFDGATIRRTVYEFYKTERTVPTVSKLRQKLSETTNFRGGDTSLREILKNLGFKWKKTRTNRQVLVERHHIRDKRICYLQDIMQYRKEEREIVFVSETYIQSSHTPAKSWTGDSNEGLLAPLSRGQRWTVIHAGGEKGFVPNALQIWKSAQRSGDFHHHMYRDDFEKWLKDQLIPNLKPNSVIVLNASYHNVSIEKVPTSNSTKLQMTEWLKEKGIPFDHSMFKTQLYSLIKLHKPAFKRFSVDEILKNHGHIVLCLPPYHPELNPMEKIWTVVKGWLTPRNTTFKIEDVRALCVSKFICMQRDDWLPFSCHVKNIEAEYWEQGRIIDEIQDKIIIPLGASDSCSESESDWDSEDSEGDITRLPCHCQFQIREKREDKITVSHTNGGSSHCLVTQEAPGEHINGNDQEVCEQPLKISLPEIKVEMPDVEEEETVVGRGGEEEEEDDMKEEQRANIPVKVEEDMKLDDTGGGMVVNNTKSSGTQKKSASSAGEFITPDDPSGEGCWLWPGDGTETERDTSAIVGAGSDRDLEKPFCCETCGAVFRHRANMLRHQMVHSTQKPFGCDLYRKPFTKFSKLKTHHSAEKS